MSDIRTTLDAVDRLADGVKISASTFDVMVTYLSPDRYTCGRIAYAVRTRGIEGIEGDGNASLTLLSDRTGIKRPSLSQWSTCVGYVVDAGIGLSPETFGLALRAYNTSAAGRTVVRTGLAAIKSLPNSRRLAAFKRLVNAAREATPDAPKKAATAPATAPVTAPAADTPDAVTVPAPETRSAILPDGSDVRARTDAFVSALETLAREIGDGDTCTIAPNNADANRIEHALDTIRDHVFAYVTAEA